MKISGFSFARNATGLYYPVRESVASILPLVDEFVIAVGRGAPGDLTRKELLSLQSPKVKIVDTEWNLEKFPEGMEHAHQTDIAKSHCSGDWLFYLQADEVVHEKYHSVLLEKCLDKLHDKRVEGLLFGYKHFWGDYRHYVNAHGWYNEEIRIVRNDPEIHSWQSAQSFRRIPEFDGTSYRQKGGTRKLRVARVGAEIYHYGWVRPPEIMRRKMRELDTIHLGDAASGNRHDHLKDFQYGDLSGLPVFTDTHPEVMKDWIARFNWEDQLVYNTNKNLQQPLHKHERLRNKFLTFLEQRVFGRTLGAFKNYVLVE